MRFLVFDIKRYAINDGPGIRTTLFLKGCPLRCAWCHNPESWSSEPQRCYKQNKCIGCRSCVEVCPQGALQLTSEGIRPTEAVCLLCGRCADECPTMAQEICGKVWTMEALMAEVEKERIVMEESGGGVTLSGGEPLMHPEDTLALLRALGSRGFHRVVDTSLYATEAVVAEVAAECDLWLADLKMMDTERHQRMTGVGNEPILRNMRWLAEHGCDFVVRIPLIEGVNADEENMEQTARFLHSLPWERRTVHLLPYHEMGRDKLRRLWIDSPSADVQMTVPKEETLSRCQRQLETYGLQVERS